MTLHSDCSRREAIKTLGLGAALLGTIAARGADSPNPMPNSAVREPRRIHQSVCRWCYQHLSLDELCAAAAAIGLSSVELITPDEFAVAQRHGLICAMVSNPVIPLGEVKVGSIPHAWNRREYHAALIPAYEEYLRLTAKAGFPNLICFSGNRGGMSDEEGLKACAEGIRKITPLAETLGVTVCMELLNSRVNHKDYMCDHTDWGVELVRRVGSERFKLLYDIYHMQIMEGDVIATIRTHHASIAHYHTAGVPGRHEIDQTQELNYPAIMRAIADTGFKGFVAQEFVPANKDILGSLKEAVHLCDV